MKQFSLSDFSDYNNAYCVVLGNRAIVTFGSKRNINYFLADTNRFLDKCLVELNSMYIDVFKEYRSVWLITMNSKTGNKVSLRDEEHSLHNYFVDLLNLFNRLANTEQGNTSGSWSFIYMQKICTMMKDLISQLLLVCKQKCLVLNTKQMEMIDDRLVQITNKINQYPEVKPKRALSVRRN